MNLDVLKTLSLSIGHNGLDDWVGGIVEVRTLSETLGTRRDADYWAVLEYLARCSSPRRQIWIGRNRTELVCRISISMDMRLANQSPSMVSSHLAEYTVTKVHDLHVAVVVSALEFDHVIFYPSNCWILLAQTC